METMRYAPALLPEGQAPAAPGNDPEDRPGLVAPARMCSGATASKLTAIAARLREVGNQIMLAGMACGRLLKQGGPFNLIEDEAAWLRTLLGRRELILAEYKRHGGQLRDIYTTRERAVI